MSILSRRGIAMLPCGSYGIGDLVSAKPCHKGAPIEYIQKGKR